MANSKNITFDQLYESLVRVKDMLDGKANTMHGTHVAYALSTTELIPGQEGHWGSAANVARGDHTHTLPAYPTKLPNPQPLTFVVGEQKDDITYDGSEAKQIEISLDSIGSAPIMHASISNTYGLSSTTEYGHAKATSTIPLMAGSADIGAETTSFARGDHVHPEQRNVTGNAGTADKLKNPVTITVGLTGKEFDGSSDIIWELDEIGAATPDQVEQATDEEIETMIKTILNSIMVDPDIGITYATDMEVITSTQLLFDKSTIPTPEPDDDDDLNF